MDMLSKIVNQSLSWINAIFGNINIVLVLVGLVIVSKIFQIRVKK